MHSAVYEVFYTAEERHWWFRARRRIVAAVLDQEFHRRDLRIADVGCGTGGMARILSRFGAVTGVDEAPEAAAFCARRGLSVMTMADWQAKGEAYDLVSAFDVVEHTDHDVDFLRGLRGRLAPGGKLVMTVPAYQAMWSVFDDLNHHRRRYTRRRLRRSLEEAGFRVTRITHFNVFLLAPIVAFRLWARTPWGHPGEPDEALRKWFRVGPMNDPLEAVFASERHWLRRGSFPLGCSILAVARPAG